MKDLSEEDRKEMMSKTYVPSENARGEVNFKLTQEATANDAKMRHAENFSAPSALDVQVGGGHYKDFAIQPIEFTMANKLNFCQGNIIKYVCRYNVKNGIEDLKKAKHYIDLLVQLEYPNANQGKTTE